MTPSSSSSHITISPCVRWRPVVRQGWGTKCVTRYLLSHNLLVNTGLTLLLTLLLYLLGSLSLLFFCVGLAPRFCTFFMETIELALVIHRLCPWTAGGCVTECWHVWRIQTIFPECLDVWLLTYRHNDLNVCDPVSLTRLSHIRHDKGICLCFVHFNLSGPHTCIPNHLLQKYHAFKI